MLGYVPADHFIVTPSNYYVKLSYRLWVNFLSFILKVEIFDFIILEEGLQLLAATHIYVAAHGIAYY